MSINTKLNIRSVKVSDMNMAKYNPRKDLKPGDSEYEKLKKSMEGFDYVDPIIWNERTGNVVGGHQRLKVLIADGATEVDVSVVNKTLKEEKALNIALNKISGAWEEDALADLLRDLEGEGLDLAMTGFDAEELDDLLGKGLGDVTEDEVPEPPEIPKSKRGEIYQLGAHRVMCGDSTSKGDVAALMGEGGRKGDCVWTDPPWNVNYGGADHPSWKKRSIENDNMSTEHFFEFLTAAFENTTEQLKQGAMAYVVMSAQEWGSIMQVMTEKGFHWSSTIIWAKDRLVLARKDYHTQYEPIWYGWLDGAPRLRPLEDRKQSDVWNIDRPSRSDEHPTMKPVELVARCLNNSSRKGDLVLDPFGGSGTTLIAAEQLGRTCYMMEIDPRYVDVIIKRWETLTGGTAELIEENGGDAS